MMYCNFTVLDQSRNSCNLLIYYFILSGVDNENSILRSFHSNDLYNIKRHFSRMLTLLSTMITIQMVKAHGMSHLATRAPALSS